EEEAFARRQVEEFDATLLRAIVYKFDKRSSNHYWTPSKLGPQQEALVHHCLSYDHTSSNHLSLNTCMEPEIQQNLEKLHAHKMLLELKTLFAQQAEQELLQTTRDFHSCKQEERQTLEKELSSVFSQVVEEEKNAASGPGGSGLRASRKLKPGALSMYVGNGQRKAVEAIDVFYLCLPSGLEIVLNNCHYALSITRGVISVFCLYEDGFINRFMNNTIQVSRNNMVYFSVILRGGIFETDLSNSYTNKSSIYAIRNKRAKLDLDSALLWHCRLRHISKKRIEKL
nr:hypothetical protein [Tanacetum cinerariifolium]